MEARHAAKPTPEDQRRSKARRRVIYAATATGICLVSCVANQLLGPSEDDGKDSSPTPAATSAAPTPRESVQNIADVCAVYPNAQVKKDFGVAPAAAENHGGVEGEAANCQIALGAAILQIDVNCSRGAEAIWTDLHRGYGEQIHTGGKPQADGAYIHPEGEETWYAGARATKPNGDMCVIDFNAPYTMPGVSHNEMKQNAIDGIGHVYPNVIEKMGLVVPPEELGLNKLVTG